MNRGSWVSGGCGHRRGRTSPVAPRPVSWLSGRRRMPVRSFAVITAVLSPGCTRHQHTPESCGAREIAHGDRMTFAISLQLPARGTGLAGPAGRRRAGSWKHARAQKAAVSPTARRSRARAQPPAPAVPPPRHQARVQPSPNATRPDPDAGPRHPQPPAPDESDVAARTGCCGRRRSPPGE
jgi:hypothetical protein